MIESYQRDLGPGRTFEIDLEPEKSSMLDGINELIYLAAVTKGEHQLATILVNALEKGVAAKPDKLLRYAAFVSKDVKKPYDQAIHVDLAAVVKSAIAAVDEPEPQQQKSRPLMAARRKIRAKKIRNRRRRMARTRRNRQPPLTRRTKKRARRSEVFTAESRTVTCRKPPLTRGV